jgi:thiamine pyrophosphate-dependent acetolactate synthase large subunit-like protein
VPARYVDLGVVGDVRATLQALLPLLDQKRDGTHLAQARQHYAKARMALDELAVGTPGKRLIHPQQIAKAISDHAAEDAVFTCDVGLPTVWAARYLAMNGQAAAPRLVLARLDGERDGAGHRRPGRVPGPAGDLALGRWRLHHADG